MTDKSKIDPYPGAAGGWGALINSGRQLLRQETVLRGSLSLLKVNQPDGFDCPGCAWPEPKHAHTFEFCENGVKAVSWETTSRRVDPAFFARHSVSSLLEQTDHWLEKQGRLTHPMRYNRATDHYEPISWPDAFALIAQKLHALDHPDQAVFYTSGRTSNEAAFLYQLFIRLLGTNNLPDCSNMCHESSGAALFASIGIGKGTVTVEDFELADAIFVVGQNPGTNHPRMLGELQKAAERGCKIVAINPLKERGLERFAHPQRPTQMLTGSSTDIASLYLQPQIGSDLALFTGLIKLVLDAEDQRPGSVLDHAFIRQHTLGFEEMAAHARAVTWDTIERETGLKQAEIAQAGEVYLQANRVIICWAMGLTQHKHAVPTIQNVVNLLLLRGMIGKPGAGACPVRGHSNVQGDRTVGITERPGRRFLQRLGEVFNFTPPDHHGYDVVGAIDAMSKGEAKVFIGMGGNFVSATPDTHFTMAALRNCALTAHVSTKLNRSHLVVGEDALILPCLGRTELDLQAAGPQCVTVEDSMSMVHASRGSNPPASEHLLSEPAIVAGLARATFPDSSIAWEEMVADYRKIRDKIAAVLPAFADYNQRITAPGGFYLGNSARERQWTTTTGKANFAVAEIPTLATAPDVLRMMTIRSHDQYNTTVYDLDDRYRGIYGTRMVVLMNELDIIDRRLADGDVVRLVCAWDDNQRRAVDGFRVTAYDIPRGCCATYFPESNPLVAADQFAEVSRTPVSKFVPVRVERMTGQDGAVGR